jgi:hypothetical protein
MKSNIHIVHRSLKWIVIALLITFALLPVATSFLETPSDWEDTTTIGRTNLISKNCDCFGSGKGIKCGDANGDDEVTPADGYHILNYFGGGPPPLCCWVANVNGDDVLTPADGYHLLNYLGGGPELNCQNCTQ